ncbi:hypothetical protein ACP275_11G035000 [Erythranthe tilingii]
MVLSFWSLVLNWIYLLFVLDNGEENENNCNDPSRQNNGEENETNCNDPSRQNNGEENENNCNDPSRQNNGEENENNCNDPSRQNNGEENENNCNDPSRQNNGEENENNCNNPSRQNKPRFIWTVEFHGKFVEAIDQLGIEEAIPEQILDLLNVDGLTEEIVGTHLQKYKLCLRRLREIQMFPNVA